LKIIHFIINTNILIALAAVSLTLATQVQLGMQPQLHAYLAVIFSATLFIYNLHKFVSVSMNTQAVLNEKYKWAAEHLNLIKILILTSLCGLALALFFVMPEFLYILAPLALLSFLYLFPVSGIRRNKFRFLKLTGSKTLLLALVWTVATVSFPVLQSMNTFKHSYILLTFCERFAYIFAIAIPFDIRDMRADALSWKNTIPNVFGEESALKFSNIALILSLSIATFHYLDVNMIFILPAYLFSIVSTFIFINNKALKSLHLYHHGILDGCILLHGALILLSYSIVV
jgi:hypothetical protein